MKAVIQRCISASVIADGKPAGSINKGLLVLVGVTEADTSAESELLANKVSALRIFTDDNDKMNLSVADVGGSILAVSNFTLCADSRKGNRPSFSAAMEPNSANDLYKEFCKRIESNGILVQKGVFGADMQVSMVGDGPVTIVLDTDIWSKK
ncbi:MAG: D-tyrosyl-tRNA(Tyr) deacylase [Clostridia bacterium]|nr:D-tyrosyl-tRNA(Tyr) deacylase [Clostridia bacterium]